MLSYDSSNVSLLSKDSNSSIASSNPWKQVSVPTEVNRNTESYNEKQLKRRFLIKCARSISGIIFIRYAGSQKIGKPNNKSFGAWKVHKQNIENLLRSPILLLSTKRPQILTCVILIYIFISNSLDRALVVYKWAIVSFTSESRINW